MYYNLPVDFPGGTFDWSSNMSESEIITTFLLALENWNLLQLFARIPLPAPIFKYPMKMK